MKNIHVLPTPKDFEVWKQEYPTCGCGSNWFNITTKNKPFCFKCGKGIKQETLEEFIKRESKSVNESIGIVKGVKWQQEQKYSEEKIDKILQKLEEIKIMINAR